MSELITAVIVAVVFFFLGLLFYDLVRSRKQKKERQMQFIYEILQYIQSAKELRNNEIDETLSMLERNIYEHLLFTMEIPNNKNECRLNFETESEHTIMAWQEAKSYFESHGMDTIRKDALHGLLSIDHFEMFQKKLKEVPLTFNEKYTGENALSSPPLEVAKWLDGPTSLEQLRGKVVLLIFWDMGCETCMKMLPELEKLKRKYGDNGLEIISIATPCEDDAPVTDFFSKHHFTFRKAIASLKTFTTYQLPGSQIPMFFIINKNGNIVESPRHKLPSIPVIEELLKS